ncbi:hypothetical protein [Cellulomonas triticagri]|uniref:Polymer-forming cytoskeletal protein n=1 Tax=Cellulomonas triticagri TaxID=2483352 RepID=A0A3M2JT77_9CELL|nr:hypothetical protein [Cellulomonas triticagri]RMI13438.1 hypothetical protein EBM89_04255 [Cellulomonas triticagri]
MKRIYSVPTALVGTVGLVLLGATAAQAVSTDCTTDLGDQAVTGDLRVPAGATCVLGGATVEGSITVEADGWLDATSVTVTGDVVATDPYGVLLDGTRVDGDVSAYTTGSRVGFLYLNDLTVGGDVAAGGLDVEVTASEIGGSLTTQAATYVDLLQTGVGGDVAVADSDWGVTVAGAVVRGSVSVTGSSRDVLVGATADGAADTWGNTIGQDLVLTGNTANLRVAGTTVLGTIRLADNDPAAAFGPGNTAGAVDGEHTGDAPGEVAAGDQSLAVTVPEQRAGELVWSLEGTSGLVNLGVAEELEDRYQATGEIVPVRVQDTRAGDPEWSITAQVSDFTAGDQTLSAKHLGWTPEVLENGGDAVAGPAVPSGFEEGDGLSVARTLASAETGHARGASVVGADLDLQLPLDTPSGTFTATLTLTALS